MKDPVKRFLLLSGITALVLFVAGYLVFKFLPEHHRVPLFPLIIGFFFIITNLIHLYQVRHAKKNMRKVTQSTVMVTTGKLFLYSALAILYIAFNKEHAIAFVIILMICYIAFNTLQIKELSRFLRSRRG